MDILSIKQKQLRDLRIVIAIAVVLILYITAVTLWPHIGISPSVREHLHFVPLLIHGLAIWLFGLIWIAYRRWRDASRREERLVDIFFSINPVVLLVIDSDGTIIECNPAVKKVLGYEPSELEGSRVDSLAPGLRKCLGDSREINGAQSKSGFDAVNAEVRTKSGESITVEIVTCDLKARAGTVSLIKDVTERVRAEQALREAKERVEEANREKGELLVKLQENYDELEALETLRDSLVHMIVHDMKAPLQAIMLSLDMLGTRAGTSNDMSSEKEMLGSIRTNSSHLSDMIKSLLDVNQLEAGELSLDVRSCDAGDIAGQATQSIVPLAAEQKIQFDAPQTPVGVVCDPDIIRRVIVNLLDNARKYSPDGEEIRLSVTQDDAQIRVAVQDFGPGIAHEYHELIFEKFSRVKTANDERRSGSSGLGLTFCKLAIEAHGGEIGVDSQPGKGSTFWFTVPCPVASVCEDGIFTHVPAKGRPRLSQGSG